MNALGRHLLLEMFDCDLDAINSLESVKGALVEQTSMEELRRGDTLENRFIQLAGADAVAAPAISWLEAAT